MKRTKLTPAEAGVVVAANLVKKSREKIVDVELCRGPINRTWGQIAFDCGFVRSNAGAIELCIDADRLTSFARGAAKDDALAAEKELDRAIKQHGYSKVLRALARSISLV